MRLALRASLFGCVLLPLGFVAAQYGNAADPRNDKPKPGSSIEAITHAPAEVARILDNSCHDCHTGQTRWPWYSHLPVIGSELERHVKEGRTKLDFTDWKGHVDASEREDKLESICIQAKARKMPPPPYLLLHPQTRPSDAEVETLCKWTAAELAKHE